jgi:hypothetical protein
MKRQSLSWDRGFAVSLGLTVAILAAGVVTLRGAEPAHVHPPGTAYGVQPDDLGRIIGISDYIVEGTVREVDRAVWTTPNRLRPASLNVLLSDEQTQLRTAVVLEVESVQKGEKVPGAIKFSLPGGEDGDVAVSSPLGVRLEPGQRILAFLSSAPPEAGRWKEISPLFPQLIFVVKNGALAGPDKTITRENLTNQLRRAAL